MKPLADDTILERIQFFNGQRLFASDLQAVEYFDRKMRWLHNKSLHQPGIGSGYAVVGIKGDREVTISPGYAIDALGREIILTESHKEQVPPIACDGNGKPVLFDLVVSYPDDEKLEEAEAREGICLPHGVVRLCEKPIFSWVQLDANGQPNDAKVKAQIHNAMKVMLARVEILNCQLNQAVSTAQRRNAKPAKQPYISAGTTQKGKTEWQLLLHTSALIGFYVDVNTSNSQFQSAPWYFAEIIGDNIIRKDPGDPLDWPNEFIIDGFKHIAPQEKNSFRLYILILPWLLKSALSYDPTNVLDDPRDAINVIKREWHITWLGIEE